MSYFSACPKDCYDSCSIITIVENNLLKITGNKNHPITSGFLCLKSKHFIEAHLNGRIVYPMERTGNKGSGEFRRITWDYALEKIGEKMKNIMNEHGPESILPVEYAGNRGIISYHFPQRLFNYLGLAKLNHSICDEAGSIALKDIFGTSIGVDPEEIKNSKLVVYWGINPAWTNIHGWKMAKMSGAKIYVVDPLITESAKAADTHIRLKVGTDVDLLLTMLNILKKRGYEIGPAEKYAREYEPDKYSKVIGIETQKIEKFVDDLITLKPLVIHIGYGFQRNLYGATAVKMIAYLLAILGEEGRFIYDAKHRIDYTYVSGMNDKRKIINQADLGKEILKNGIKILIIYNHNPLVSLSNQNLLRKVLSSEDIFVVVHDIYMTDTALYSDIFLPATTFFEHEDIVDSYYHDYLNYNQKIFDPAGEAKSNHDLFVELAKKLDLKDPYLFEDEKSIIKNILRKANVDEEKFFRDGFVKIERIRTEIGPDLNSILRDLENYKRYENEGFRLLSPTHVQGISSQHNNLYPFDTYAYMNPVDALKMGIKSNDFVKIYNEFGSIETKVKIDEKIEEKCIVIYKGSWPSIYGWNVNFLTTDTTQEGYGRVSAVNTTFVQVEKL